MEAGEGYLLVVDPDPAARTAIRRAVSSTPHKVLEASSGEEALECMRLKTFRLVVLEALLPGMDGFETCAAVKTLRPDQPIIMVASLGRVTDRIRGLSQGADDYMVKPFSAEELVARIRAILRRARESAGTSDVLQFRDLQIDLHAQKCFKAGRETELTPKEFRILFELCRSRGVALSREDLSERVWGRQHHGSEKSLDVHIRRLRQKVEDQPSDPSLIRTVWGYGYICE